MHDFSFSKIIIYFLDDILKSIFFILVKMYKKQQLIKWINDLSDVDEMTRQKAASFMGFFITMYALRQFEIKLELLVKYLLSFSFIEMLIVMTVLGLIGFLIKQLANNLNKIKFHFSNRLSR